jgi:hypothetical protein
MSEGFEHLPRRLQLLPGKKALSFQTAPWLLFRSPSNRRSFGPIMTGCLFVLDRRLAFAAANPGAFDCRKGKKIAEGGSSGEWTIYAADGRNYYLYCCGHSSADDIPKEIIRHARRDFPHLRWFIECRGLVARVIAEDLGALFRNDAVKIVNVPATDYSECSAVPPGSRSLSKSVLQTFSRGPHSGVPNTAPCLYRVAFSARRSSPRQIPTQGRV